jgi:hypothetical protein
VFCYECTMEIGGAPDWCPRCGKRLGRETAGAGHGTFSGRSLSGREGANGHYLDIRGRCVICGRQGYLLEGPLGRCPGTNG